MDLTEEGIVFNIQRFSIHDGPGIRTTVFLKGCTLRCFWCHNPEGIRPQLENQFYPERCIGCGECVTVCPEGAQSMGENGRAYDRERCKVCGKCVEICYAGALLRMGNRTSAGEVCAEALRDRAFYQSSGGGVTLSGGEPVMQRDFSRAILEGCKAEGLHTAIETAGHYRWEDLAGLLPFVDLVMMDIKHMDRRKHHRATGVTNERILANATRLAGTGLPLLFRIPVVPTVNDTEDEIAAIARFVHRLGALRAAAQQTAPLSPAAADSASVPDSCAAGAHLTGAAVISPHGRRQIPQPGARGSGRRAGDPVPRAHGGSGRGRPRHRRGPRPRPGRHTTVNGSGRAHKGPCGPGQERSS